MSGMEPGLMALLGGGLGGVGAMFGQNAETAPFDSASNDPEGLLTEGTAATRDLAGLLSARLAEPISLPGTAVQQLPTFTGGGLPMPIGAFGQDQALDDPSLLSLGGLGGSDFLGGTGGSRGAPSGPNDETDSTNNPNFPPGGDADPGVEQGEINEVRRRPLGSSVRDSLGEGGALFGGGGGDDQGIDQARGAVDLFLESQRAPRRQV